MAIQWANFTISIFQRVHGGCASLEEALAWESLAWLLLNKGPAHNVQSATKLAAHAAAMRAACDAAPNDELMESIATSHESHADGVIDRFGNDISPEISMSASEKSYETNDDETVRGYAVRTDAITMSKHLIGIGNFVLNVLDEVGANI
jgi:hypothetical protein